MMHIHGVHSPPNDARRGRCPNRNRTAGFVGLVLVSSVGCMQTLATRVAPDRASLAEADARRAIASERTLADDSLPVRSLGIPPLRVSAADTTLAPLGYGMADMLMTDLSRSAQVQIVDRL